ncbi:MAG TPA: hypothetical protein DCX53_05020 [Anaerolineae bacterium]|nr:hypothetical protein [Anaerolineae bacterium]
MDVVHPDSGCEATDQRGVIRPQGTHCDLGAYEYGASILTVTNTTPASGATLQSLTSILVTFNETALSDGSADAANNTANYILVEDGVNNIFDTVNCLDGVASDDVQQAISSVSYSDPTATLHLASPLSPGNYRLFICGTTSIWSAAGLELNNGDSDTTVDFTVGSIASSLPDTGFAPNRVTSLPAQSTHYANLGSIWLEIPSLGVKSEIVGVPQSSQGWNVDWLGNSTGWLHGTAFPSWEGNSVITAHVYDSNGLPGPFNNIKKLNHGDQVIVHLAGEKYIFEVRDSSMVFPSTTKSALEHLEGHSYLTLITCQWYNPVTDSYAFRRVVRAVLVSVQPE